MGNPTEKETLHDLIETLFQAHPWHGVPAFATPELVNVFVEVVPGDTVKFELDKHHGHLRVDRPQRFSSRPPAPYGFIPRTLCAARVGSHSAERTGRGELRGDGDPMDLCVLTDAELSRSNFLLRARPIGGLRLLDRHEADDKIVAVLEDDVAYGGFQELADVPAGLLARLRHYFLTYKQSPDAGTRQVEIDEIYGRDEALETIRLSREDYREQYGAPDERFRALLDRLSRDR